MWTCASVAFWVAAGPAGLALEARAAAAIPSAGNAPAAHVPAAHTPSGYALAGVAGRAGLCGAGAVASRTANALAAKEGSDVAALVAQRGEPLHALGGPRGALVLVWEWEGAPTVAWFDGSGALTGALGTDQGGAQRDGLGDAPVQLRALDPARAPALSYASGRATLILPLADGSRWSVDLATGTLTASESGDYAAIRREAEERSREGDHAGALERLEDALTADPTDPEAWRTLARALDRSGEPQEARAVLVRGTETLHGGRTLPVSMDWRVVDPRARLAYDVVTRYEREGDLARAELALADVERLYPCMEEAVLHRAALVRAAGGANGACEADDVLRATLARLECPRTRASAHLDAVEFHERAGDLELARMHLTDALQLGEEREVVLRALARIDLARGTPELAVQALTELRERWLVDHEALTDERRRARSSERLARLDAELVAAREAAHRRAERTPAAR